MARKAIVDKDIILDLLKKGETTQRIAERFKVSRQAIDLHRKEFINRGLLPDRKAERTRKEPTILINSTSTIDAENSNVHRSTLIKPIMNTPESIESLDTQIDLMINAFNALKRLPSIEKELEDLKHENEKAKQEIERLKNREKKRLEQENRWMLLKAEDITDPSS